MGNTTKTCAVDGCERPHGARGYCGMHYQRLRRDGALPAKQPKPEPEKCTVDGCSQARIARGYCKLHYDRVRKNGTPDLPPAREGCSVEGCDRPHKTGGYCKLHYQRVMRTGEPGPAGVTRAAPGTLCDEPGCGKPSTRRGKCHNHRNKAINAALGRSSYKGETMDARLRRIGWQEVVRRPELGACWEWKGSRRGSNSYGGITGPNGATAAHRVAYETWVGPVDSSQLVCHHCDNPPCINPAHLFLGDSRANMIDAAKKNRIVYGERHHRHKVTTEQVVEIRHKYSTGLYTQKALGKEYGISGAMVGYIVNGKSWVRAPK